LIDAMKFIFPGRVKAAMGGYALSVAGKQTLLGN
jgi:hypothetical protein